MNFYEYYFSSTAVSGVLGSHVNPLGTALDACVDQNLLKNSIAPVGASAAKRYPAGLHSASRRPAQSDSFPGLSGVTN
ncbi:hypothetical protein MK280_12340, partial [Myxococcota bacterium]|nr:hypothetical protein [Myxococcota bacterium]